MNYYNYRLWCLWKDKQCKNSMSGNLKKNSLLFNIQLFRLKKYVFHKKRSFEILKVEQLNYYI